MGKAVLAGQHFMNGDHAVAEGALAAGCRFFAGYPITPSTEVAERLARRLPQVGGVYVQMEDELGSMAAIIGAAAAGANSMTATSGPGLSLMVENIGLAVMMEMPCVVVDIQRGSPSTGLPTMTGQSDVMQARWGSHGDYEILAYAPWSPQESFSLIIHAFNTSNRYRVPALILSDEVVGHMVERVTIPQEDKIERWPRKKPKTPPNGKFQAFKVEDTDLIPPIAHAGEGYKVHYTGLTHDERGYPDMNADTHHQLVTRLVQKIKHNADQIIMTEDYNLEKSKIIVISYGSTARSARRAVRDARKMGIPVGLLRLVSIWPFPEELIKDLGQIADAFVVAEMNLGQIAQEVERHVSQPVHGVFHAGGRMIHPETILNKIMEVAKGAKSRRR